ncbi:ribokinase [Alkalihalobacillus sp. TS-13]|uniref:ribokinase n=1 Tax=Alkalihalobacillus sp. TS-13 TaxID=2842455 RepID=UPI001C87A543|nr:ribokinase [Alkalihalobacillus sp. TS-13]
MSIVVIGGFTMDLIVSVERAPDAGETILGNGFYSQPGGKGANQAVAVSRAGGDVKMIGKLGNDHFGDEVVETLSKENIDISFIERISDQPTGVGLIVVDKTGENKIVVVPGANKEFQVKDIKKVENVLKGADMILQQFEMDIDMTLAVIDFAYHHGKTVLVNPAPARSIPDEVYKKINYLTPNESEASMLTGIAINDVDDAILAGQLLYNKGVQCVIITLSNKGSVIVDPEGARHIESYPVQAIDSVAAGDAFNGYFASGIIKGLNVDEAVIEANAAGALTVTKPGAIPAIPYYKDVQNISQKIT